MTREGCQNVEDAETLVSLVHSQTVFCIPLLQPRGGFWVNAAFYGLQPVSPLWPLTPDTHQAVSSTQLSLTGYFSYLVILSFVKYSDEPVWAPTEKITEFKVASNPQRGPRFKIGARLLQATRGQPSVVFYGQCFIVETTGPSSANSVSV